MNNQQNVFPGGFGRHPAALAFRQPGNVFFGGGGASISQERLLYIPVPESNDGVARVIYKGKNSRTRETFAALDWLARLVTHIPNRGEQLVRYYRYYSNKSRGMRKKRF